LGLANERRIRRETELSTAFLASLVESCDDAIVGIRLDGTVVSWNAGAEKLYGYTAAEMMGCSLSALFPRYRPEELPDLLERIAAGEHVHQSETVRMRKDGLPVEVSLTVSPVRDSGGRIVGASTVARDITHRKEEDNERLALIQDLTSALARVNSLTTRPES
jgi:PAS domain S-box-containing protein